MLVRRTPKDLGQAKAGWQVSKPKPGSQGAEVSLYNDAPYVAILELGARPHKVSLEGRIAIYEWVLRNIPPTPVSGPVRHQREKSGGRRQMQQDSTEAVAMQITQGIVRKLFKKGQKGKFFVAKSMDELNRDFGRELNSQIAKYSKRRAKRKGSK